MDVCAYGSRGNHPKRAPAMVADIMVASDAASRALIPRRERSPCRSGAIPPIPPIWIAIELKFANPHKEYVAMIIDFSLSRPSTFISERLR